MRTVFVLLLATSVAPAAWPQVSRGAEAEFRIDNASGSLPDASADRAGRFIVVWQQFNGDGSGIAAVGRRLSPSGDTLGSEFVVNEYTTGDQANVSVAAAPDGRFMAVWVDSGRDGSGLGVFGRLFLPSGLPAGPDFAIGVTTAGDQSVPRVATIEGGFLVVWRSEEAFGLDHIFAQVYDQKGSTVLPEFEVPSVAGAQFQPAAAGLRGGGFVVAWSDNLDLNTHVRVRVFDATGPRGPETQADTQIVGVWRDLRNAVAVAARPDGGFTLAWHMMPCTIVPQPMCVEGGLQAREYDAGGVPLGTESTFVPPDHPKAFELALGISGRGVQLAVWSTFEQDGSGYGVYARRFGQLFPDAPFRVNISPLGDQRAAAVAVDPAGKVLVVWQTQGHIVGRLLGGLPPVDLDPAGNHMH